MKPPNFRPHGSATAINDRVAGCAKIRNQVEETVNDAGALALAALGWVLADNARARRFLDLTGLTPERLRTALDRPETHLAVLDFVVAHEPDLLAASDAIGVPPGELAGARERLGR